MRHRAGVLFLVSIVPFMLWSCDTRRSYRNVPPAPTELAGATGSPEVHLRWKDNSKNETYFTVERKVGDGKWEIIAQVEKDVTSYLDQDVPAGTLRYRVTADNKYGRSTRSNEIGVLVAEDVPVLHDLAVVSIDRYEVSCPEPGIAGGGSNTCETTVEFTVQNQGNSKSGSFSVEVAFDGDEAGPEVVVIGGLDAGESRSSVATREGRFRGACVTADGGKEIDETDEEDNRLCSGLPDLSVLDLQGPFVSCIEGCSTTSYVLVQNSGPGDAGAFTVKVTFDDKLQESSETIEVQVPDGQRAGTSVWLAVTAEGEFSSACAFADSEGQVTEFDESDNAFCHGQADLVVPEESIDLRPVDLEVCDPGVVPGGGGASCFEIVFTIENRGAVAVDQPFHVRLEYAFFFVETDISEPLDVGGKVEKKVIVPACLACAKGCGICITVDETSLVPESNEDDNLTCRIVDDR